MLLRYYIAYLLPAVARILAVLLSASFISVTSRYGLNDVPKHRSRFVEAMTLLAHDDIVRALISQHARPDSRLFRRRRDADAR